MDKKEQQIFFGNMLNGWFSIRDNKTYRDTIKSLEGEFVCVVDASYNDPFFGRPAPTRDRDCYLLSSNGKDFRLRYERIQSLFCLDSSSLIN